MPNCPKCGQPLKRVLRDPGCLMNQDQFDAMKAGDYYCLTCPGNGRGKSGLCYWLESELQRKV